MAQALGALRRGDNNSAALMARSLLQWNPNHAGACRLLAQIADRDGYPEAIVWWARAADLGGQKFEDISGLVASALRHGEVGVAGEALQRMREADRKLAAAHLLWGAYAAATGQQVLAEEEFHQAGLLRPDDQSIQLSLASICLQSRIPETVTAARSSLEGMKRDPVLRSPALRALLMDARSQGNAVLSLQIAGELAGSPDAMFEDQLIWLDEIRRSRPAEFGGRLAALEMAAAKNPGQAGTLAHWMNARSLAQESLNWQRQLPAALQSQPLMQFSVAESLSVTGNWEELWKFLETKNWAEMDCLRRAIQSRAARETGRRLEATGKWDEALTVTGGDLRLLYMLARLVNGWGWRQESEQVWWLIARHSAGQHEALKSLYNLYATGKDTLKLYQVIQRIYEVDPQDPIAINNLAAVSLLLGKNTAQAHVLAAKNYEAHRDVPAFATTRAYSLLLQKKGADGLRILEALPEGVRRQPQAALYYGLLLASAGEQAKAQDYLDIAEQGSEFLLTKEKNLIHTARRP